MAFADVAKKEHTSTTSLLAALFPLEVNTPGALLGLAALGPCFVILTTALASGVHNLPLISSIIALFSVVLLLKWRLKGLLGALSLVALGYLARVFIGAQIHPFWELGFFFSQGLGIYMTYQCFEECVEVYERDTLAVAEDFEKLKEVHATYTSEKASECERLKNDVAQKDAIILDTKEEISSLKNVVLASSAQAASFAEKNKALQEKTFELHKVVVELKEKRQTPSIGSSMLKALNALRVENFQKKQLIDHVLSIMHPLRVDALDTATVKDEPAQEEPVAPEKAILLEKEKEKAAIKKSYYEQLDTCNSLKATYSQDLSNQEAKKAYDEASSILKKKKAALVTVEKELFSLKKELRDQGKLFS